MSKRYESDKDDLEQVKEILEKFPGIMGGNNAGIRILWALNMIVRFGGIDGAHHKAWVLDQVTRILVKEDYESFVDWANEGEEGPDTYDWETGIGP
jgi:hypothetical protein